MNADITSHPLTVAATRTFKQARAGFAEAIDYFEGGAALRDVSRMRVGLGALAAACDAVKAAANALSTTIGHVQRAPKEGP